MIVTYAIVYATNSKMLRRIIADDDGCVYIGAMPDGTPAVITAHIRQSRALWLTTSCLFGNTSVSLGYHRLMAGEAALIVPKSSKTPAHDFFDWCRQVEMATGVRPQQIVCDVIDSEGRVLRTIVADPEIDQAPAGCFLAQRSSRVAVTAMAA